MEIKAELHRAHLSPRKVRLVADAIRGMNVRQAEALLNHLPKRSSLPVLKLLKSAQANAVHHAQLDGSDLSVKDIKVNPGPAAKRMMPRAFGRAATIRKRTSHILIVLDVSIKSQNMTPMSLRKNQELVIRDAKIEDLKAAPVSSGRREQQPSSSGRGVKKSLGFARRIFQRKVI